jgi:hypothetical protein
MSPIEISSSDEEAQETTENPPIVAETSSLKDLMSERTVAQPQASSKNISASSIGNPLGMKNRDVLYPAGPVKVRMQEDPASDSEVEDLEVVIAKNRTLAQGNRRTGTLEASYILSAIIGSTLRLQLVLQLRRTCLTTIRMSSAPFHQRFQ